MTPGDTKLKAHISLPFPDVAFPFKPRPLSQPLRTTSHCSLGQAGTLLQLLGQIAAKCPARRSRGIVKTFALGSIIPFDLTYAEVNTPPVTSENAALESSTSGISL